MILVRHFSRWGRSSESVVEMENLEIPKIYWMMANYGYFLFPLFLLFKTLRYKLKTDSWGLPWWHSG